MNNIECRDKGLAYIADQAVFEELINCRKLLFELNHTPYYEFETITDADKRKLFKNEEIDQQAWDDIIKSVEF